MKGARKMEIQSIRNLLVESGYNKSNFTIGKKVIDIPDMYIKQNKEAYIILEYLIFKEKFEEYQRKILWFQNCSDNEIIKYNINIIIVYNSSEIKDVDDFISVFTDHLLRDRYQKSRQNDEIQVIFICFL